MYLYRQSETRDWRIYWWDHGRTRSVSAGTTVRRDAERVLMAMQDAADGRADERHVEALLRAAFGGRRRQCLSIADAGQAYLGQAGESERSRHVLSHWRQFEGWCKTRPGIVTLADIDASTCRAFPAALGGSPKTVANRVADCARVYRVLAPLQGLSGDPWKGLRLSHKTSPRRALTAEECTKLLNATRGTQYGLGILLGLYTGLRYRDIAHLTWEQIQGNRIVLEPHKTTAHGIEVRIPLHPSVLVGLPERGTGYVMPALAAGYGKRGDARQFMRACRLAGVPHTGITFHSLRHTFVTRLAETGVPEDVRRRLAGHSSAATHDRYAHDAEAQRAAVEGLPGV